MQQALAGLAGVSSVTMRFDEGEFDVTYNPSAVKADALVEAVKKAGFKATVQ